MKFEIIVLTAKRNTETLSRLVRVLSYQTLQTINIFDGTPTNGVTSMQGCVAAYKALFQQYRNLNVEGLLVFEDDVAVCNNLIAYLNAIAWPESYRQIAAVSPYCPTAYSNYLPRPARWHREDKRKTLAGTQCFIYTQHFVHTLADALDPTMQWRDKVRGTIGPDVQLGWLAQARNLHIWYHIPSLVQHIGIGNSAVGYTQDLGTIYSAETFVGEDFDALTLLQ